MKRLDQKHLVKSNLEAIMLGYDYVIDNITHPLPLTVKPAKKTEGQVIIDGNTLAGLGCVYAGATVGAWYPITPSTSLMDSFQTFCNQLRKMKMAQIIFVSYKLKTSLLQLVWFWVQLGMAQEHLHQQVDPASL